MDQSPTVLVVDSDEAVIRDITTALSLIGLSVAAVPSATIALRVIAEFRPLLTLVRLTIDTKIATKQEMTARGSFPASVISAHPDFTTPLVAILHPNEEAVLSKEVNAYQGGIFLPVEFPAFTLRIQEQLGSRLNTGGKGSGARSSATQLSIGAILSKSLDSTKLSQDDLATKSKGLGPKLAEIYAIQSKVFASMMEHPTLENLSTNDLKKLLIDTTDRICGAS